MNTTHNLSSRSDAIVSVSGNHHVYLLPTLDRSRLKIGRSIEPLERITGLVSLYPEIDLGRSVIVSVDSSRIEAVLHTIFGTRRQPLPTRADGYTEWFLGDFVEEALELLDIIASHRGAEYRVIRDVESVLADFRAQQPSAGLRTPRLTEAERSVRAAQAKIRMQEAVTEHAQQLCDRISESDFDAVVRCGGHDYLSRIVCREQAPECWDTNIGGSGSAWGRRFAEMSFANLEVDGARCLFPMLHPPLFSGYRR